MLGLFWRFRYKSTGFVVSHLLGNGLPPSVQGLRMKRGNRSKNVGTGAFFSCSGSTRCDSLRMCRRQPTSPT
jgi:hypothetical protein